jgi:hypothetical protein
MNFSQFLCKLSEKSIPSTVNNDRLFHYAVEIETESQCLDWQNRVVACAYSSKGESPELASIEMLSASGQLVLHLGDPGTGNMGTRRTFFKEIVRRLMEEHGFDWLDEPSVFITMMRAQF